MYARVAQLVEHDLAKVGVAGSSPVSRSTVTRKRTSGRCPFFVQSSPAGAQTFEVSALFHFDKLYIICVKNNFLPRNSSYPIICFFWAIKDLDYLYFNLKNALSSFRSATVTPSSFVVFIVTTSPSYPLGMRHHKRTGMVRISPSQSLCKTSKINLTSV